MDNLKDKEIHFQFDDISDDYSFDELDDLITEEFATHLLEKIRATKWFQEGNKTSGTITFHSDIEFTIDWTASYMGEDYDSDVEEDYSQDVLLNMDDSQYKVVIW